MLAGEFESPEDLLRAWRELREAGHRDLEAYTPHAIDELADEEPRPLMGWFVGLAGFAGAGAAYLVQWYVAAVDYPLDVGGRPNHAPLAFVPITFEMGILAASLTAFFLLLRGAGLPRLWRPIFEIEGFERAAVDRYFLAVRDEARSALESAGARRIIAFSFLLLLAGCDFQRMTQQGKPGRFPPPVPGTVPRGASLDPRVAEGIEDARFVSLLPLEVTRPFVERGRERFEIHCAACHGVLGDSNTAVADRMGLRRPRSLLEEGVRRKAPGEIYSVIAKGFGLMPSYAGALSVEERWAVVAYLRALQLSQSARLEDLPEPLRREALEHLR